MMLVQFRQNTTFQDGCRKGQQRLISFFSCCQSFYYRRPDVSICFSDLHVMSWPSSVLLVSRIISDDVSLLLAALSAYCSSWSSRREQKWGAAACAWASMLCGGQRSKVVWKLLFAKQLTKKALRDKYQSTWKKTRWLRVRIIIIIFFSYCGCGGRRYCRWCNHGGGTVRSDLKEFLYITHNLRNCPRFSQALWYGRVWYGPF